MPNHTTTLPDRAVAHAIERARLHVLREAIADRIAQDIALLSALHGGTTKAAATAETQSQGAAV